MVDPVESFGKIIVVFTALSTALFVGYTTLEGKGIDYYNSNTENFTSEYPSWNVEGSRFNGTINQSSELTTVNSSGTHVYTSDIVSPGDSVKIDNVDIEANISSGESVELKVYSSENGFSSIESSQSFSVSDGVESKVVDLGRHDSYRFQVLMTYSGSGEEPGLSSLSLDGESYSVSRDYSVFIVMPVMMLLYLIALIAGVNSI